MKHEFKTVHYICNGAEVYAQSYRDDSVYFDNNLKNWFDNGADTCAHEITLDLNA